jgi:hypothetical protein
MVGVAADPQWGEARHFPPVCARFLIGGTCDKVLAFTTPTAVKRGNQRTIFNRKAFR